MAGKRVGAQTIELGTRPRIAAWSAIVGPKEGEGPLGGCFDRVEQDDMLGQKSFEKAECKLFESCVRLTMEKAKVLPKDVHALLGGDLLNQIISAGFAARQLAIPFYGLYGACSTMAESLAIGSMLVDGQHCARVLCATSSHFSTAERQYRTPLEMGTQRTPTAQWTVTGAGSALVCEAAAAQHARVCVTHVTTGKVVDLGVKDANNMGAAMAPAATDTLLAHFRDTGRTDKDYDLVVSGDLGSLGRELMLELLRQEKHPISPERSMDCGMQIYAPEQDVHAGGSGCGCSASVLCGKLLGELASGQLHRILFMATGALLSPTTTMQGESIPSIAQAVVLEHVGDGRKGGN